MPPRTWTIPRLIRKTPAPWAVTCIALALAGCSTPVSVSRVDIQSGYRLQTQSALSAGELSEPAQKVLRRLGMLDRFEDEPDQVLAELHRGLGLADEDRLFALAELSFLHGQQTGDRAHFLAAAVYAWALLFPGDAGAVQIVPSDPRLRLAYDLYNHAIARGLTVANGEAEEKDEVRLEPGEYPLPFGKLRLTRDESALKWGGYRLGHFIPTATLEVDGLRNRYHNPGLGTPLAASLVEERASEKIPGSDRIGPRTKVPVTALLRFDRARASLAGGEIDGRIELHAADRTSSVQVEGRDQPLESDPSAALAYQLDKSPLYALEISAFFRGGILKDLMPVNRAHDGLYTLYPYRKGKIPVVLVHGTASSPARWAELFNEMEGDPRIREKFQFWVFTYDSGNPIAYSAGRLRAALTNARREFDPENRDPALQRLVVIGHSQGGLLTKLTAIDSGSRFWDRISSKPLDRLNVRPETRELLHQSAFFTPLPFVGRVVFVATPHRGALLAAGRIGRIAAHLVSLPVGFLSQAAQAATASGDERMLQVLTNPPTAVDNMNPAHPSVKILSSIPVTPRIPAHSIIAVDDDVPKEEGDDGVVSYQSAHIDEAVSERVVRSGHSCQGTPEVIEEIRRILLEHAGASPPIGS